MVPVMDNALYHNVHRIASLASFSKKSTVKIMKEHGINYVILPAYSAKKRDNLLVGMDIILRFRALIL